MNSFRQNYIVVLKYAVVIVLSLSFDRWSMSDDGDYSCEDPLVPIPNTTVKLTHADNIWLETAREDRTLPSTCKRPE